MKTVSLLLLLWNAVVFFIYAMDKYRAKQGAWRVPEKTLLLCAFLCGGIGGFCGMMLLRHKTRHLKFKLMLPIALVVTVLALLLGEGILVLPVG